MSQSIQNLNKPKGELGWIFFNFYFFKDAFEQLEEEEGTRQGFCHIRIQQRTGRKTITTVQGIDPSYDLKKIVRYLKKVFIFHKSSINNENLRNTIAMGQ